MGGTAVKAEPRAPRWPAFLARAGRRLVQAGFLGLFIYPLVMAALKRVSYDPVPAFTSWLLPWDPLLLVGQALQRDWTRIVIGAPLLLLALTLVFGRAFCGWVCPLGTLLDAVRWLAFWQRRAHWPPRGRLAAFHRNQPWRYYLLAAILTGGLISIKLLGVFDPLVVFQRFTTSLAAGGFALNQPVLRISLPLISLIFLIILALELWQPRFWCRNLCPMGALLSLISRWSLLNRRVGAACDGCGDCRRLCPMKAIPAEPHDTSYADCSFCLECQVECPRQGITFAFGPLALRRWHKQGVSRTPDGRPVLQGRYLSTGSHPEYRPTRRQFLGGLAAGAAGLAIVPLAGLDQRAGVLRPPGALPEDEFVRACILCQECVRACPTGSLRPAFMEAGLAGAGTPLLAPRQGGCAIHQSCPDLCAQVCPTGAILPVRPDEVKIGLAQVDRELCLAWNQGVKCLVCVEACQNRAAQPFQGRVTVDPQLCTGCGRCESGCPVAGSAIHVVPLKT